MITKSSNLKYEILTEFLFNPPSEFKYFQNNILEFKEIYNDYSKKSDNVKFKSIINHNIKTPKKAEILNIDEILNCQKTKNDQIEAKISDQEILNQVQVQGIDPKVVSKEKIIDPKVIELNQNDFKDKKNEIDGQRNNFCGSKKHEKKRNWILCGFIFGIGILIVIIIFFVIKKKSYNLKYIKFEF